MLNWFSGYYILCIKLHGYKARLFCALNDLIMASVALNEHQQATDLSEWWFFGEYKEVLPVSMPL